MTLEAALELVTELVRRQGRATNRELVRALGGDAELYADVREALILDGIARDKDGVGLLLVEPASSDVAAAPPGGTRVFLSYGRRDGSELAGRLAADLEARGFSVWRDTREIRAGMAWEDTLREALRDVDLLLAVLTPHAVRTGHGDDTASVCLEEIAVARFGRPPRPIVPVLAEACEPPFSIYRLDYVDLRGWRESSERYRAGLARIADALAAARRGEVRQRSWVRTLAPWDFGAFLEEKRRRFSGRAWLFAEIERWCESPDERALLVSGDPGAGKSALVAELVHRNSGRVLAYHCCQADTPVTLQAGLCVRSIAAMAASRLPAFARLLEDPAIEAALSEQACAEDPASAFEAGVIAPLAGVEPPEGVRYLLLDGLDEALAGPPGRTTIVDLLASRLDRLPAWLRVVATTRKERGVLDRLRGLRAREIDAQDPRNRADVDLYVRDRVAGLADAERVSWVVQEKAAGNFLYAKQALDGLERGLCSAHDLDVLPPGLHGLYLRFFERLFPDPESYRTARSLLEIAIAAREPLPRDWLARASELSPDELAVTLRQLGPYLPEREGAYALFHKSLADWLTDPGLRGTTYAVEPRRGHERLFQALRMERSAFSLRHLAAHLIGAQRWDMLLNRLTDLDFVESRCAAGQAFELVADYRESLGAWPGQAQDDPFAEDRGDARGAVEDAGAARIAAFGAFVAAHAQALHDFPRETIPLARNHAAGGPVAGAAELLAAALPRAWIAREPRPPAAPRRPASLRLLRGHRERVAAVALSADGRSVVSADGSGELRLWDAASGACSRLLSGPAGGSCAVAVSADDRLAVAGNEDHTVSVWDLATAALLRSPSFHADRVASVALAPDGALAVSGGWDALVCVWEPATGRQRHALSGHGDKVTAVALAGSRVVSAGWDRALRVWDAASGECLRVLEGHTAWISALALRSDGRLAASGGWDEEIRLWDLDSGRCLRTLTGHAEPITALALTPDGRRLVSGSDDRSVRVWDLASGECLRVLRGHAGSVTAVAVAHGGRVLASASEDRSVRLWDAEGTEEPALEGHTGAVRGIRLTPDGSAAVSTGLERALRIWDFGEGRGRHLLPRLARHAPGTAVSADGARLVSVCAGEEGAARRNLRVVALETGTTLATLRGHRKAVEAVVLTPDGQLAVSGGMDGQLRVWDLDSGQCLRALGDDATDAGAERHSCAAAGSRPYWRQRLRQDAARRGFAEGVTSLALTPDGRRVVSSTWDKAYSVWDLATGACLAARAGREGMRELRRPSEDVAGAALSPGGELAVSAAWDHTLHVWLVASGAELRLLEGPTPRVERVVITPDGRRAVSAGHDSRLHVWDLASGRRLRVLRGHTGPVNDVVLTPDGSHALSASDDHTLRLWEIGSGACLAVHVAGAAVTCLSEVRPEGRFACGTEGGELHFLALRGLALGRPRVTAALLWRLHAGRHDEQATFACPWCGRRSSLPAKVQAALTDGLCSDGPDEACIDPRLASACGACGGEVRLNPFLVGRSH